MNRLQTPPPYFGLALALALASTLAVGSQVFAAEHTVNIVGLTFSPANLTVQVGDTVTWINDGGLHNVNADDGTFTSGAPSTDLWQYSYTFRGGGSYPYHCDVHQADGMVGTIEVEGIFADGMESGDTSWWSATEPETPFCDCYFSSDCTGNLFCDWGPGGPSTLDICVWRDNKPNGNPGTGCDIPHVGEWGGDICDGICAPPNLGSAIGWEELELIERAVWLWGETLLRPAEAGGGPFDPLLLADIERLPFESPITANSIGREVADLLKLAGTPEFYPYFCHFEQHPGKVDESLLIDLSGDVCRARAGRLLVEGLLSELQTPGTCGPIVGQIPKACPDSWQGLFAPRCPAGEGALDCVRQRLEDTATFLRTPKGLESRHGRLVVKPE